MKRARYLAVATWVAAVCLPAALWAIDTPRCCNDEGPLPWKKYNRGVRWETSVEKAREKAQALRKPILLFSMIGDMDKGGC